jgi:hypothetical protein
MSAKAILSSRCPALLCLFLSALFSILPAGAQSVSLAWNPSPSPAVAGYDVYYGLASGAYTSHIDVRSATAVTLSKLAPGLTYYIAVLAYDSSRLESPFSNEISESTPAPPLILTGPLNQTVIAGATASFAVIATSDIPVSFQWFDGANALPGATQATLTVPDASDGSAGNYSVVVSNSLGGVTSRVATLNVIDPPVITSQPVAQSAGVGAKVLFQVAVSGQPPFSFQWFEGTAPISAATGAALELVNVSGANAGNYYAVIQNAAGAVTSAGAALAITNAFGPVSGAYNGLFHQTSGSIPAVAVPTAGLLGNCVVGTSGAYTGRIHVGGFNYSLTGVLRVTGNDAEVVSRAANGLPSLYVTLNLDMTGASEMITGLVSNMSAANPWTAPLLADLATNAPSVPPGSFDMLLQPDLGAPDSPAAYGRMLIQSTNGVVTLAGYLGDETLVSQNVPVSRAGTIPFYCSLYGGSGLVEGWINLAGGAPNGSVTWIRPAGVTNSLPFPLGFTNVLNVCSFYAK